MSEPVAREQYNAYMKEYMRKRYAERRKAAIEKLGGKCVICGSIDDLEFDHIDPDTKTFTIAHRPSKNEKHFWEEIEKCQLLCKTCHIEKSIKDNGKQKAKGTHGTLSSYRYCRCSICKKAKAEHHKQYMAKRKNQEK